MWKVISSTSFRGSSYVHLYKQASFRRLRLPFALVYCVDAFSRAEQH